MVKRQLTPEQRAAIERCQSAADDVYYVLGDAFPNDLVNVMDTLSDKTLDRELRNCCKRGGVDYTEFSAAAGALNKSWKALQRSMNSARKAAEKTIAKCRKELDAAR